MATTGEARADRTEMTERQREKHECIAVATPQRPAQKRRSSSSPSSEATEACFVHIDGDVNGPGYNETMVDVITVPCPGADPVETWTRDPIPSAYFCTPSNPNVSGAMSALAMSAILSPALSHPLPRALNLWARQGIRKYVNTARILMYRHQELVEGVTLNELAENLLDKVLLAREGLVGIPCPFVT